MTAHLSQLYMAVKFFSLKERMVQLRQVVENAAA
jgi:hypothetical protein